MCMFGVLGLCCETSATKCVIILNLMINSQSNFNFKDWPIEIGRNRIADVDTPVVVDFGKFLTSVSFDFGQFRLLPPIFGC